MLAARSLWAHATGRAKLFTRGRMLGSKTPQHEMLWTMQHLKAMWPKHC